MSRVSTLVIMAVAVCVAGGAWALDMASVMADPAGVGRLGDAASSAGVARFLICH